LISKVVNAKNGDGYNLAKAETKNSNETMILSDHSIFECAFFACNSVDSIV
jgi:hypothetical protein